MSMINKEVSDFSVQAYQNGEFKTVTKEDILGKWSVFFFYPADFTFICPTELEDLQNKYAEFQAAGCEIFSVSTDSHFVHGMILRSELVRLSILCLRTRPMHCVRISKC